MKAVGVAEGAVCAAGLLLNNVADTLAIRVPRTTESDSTFALGSSARSSTLSTGSIIRSTPNKRCAVVAFNQKIEP